jgi:hypothetical protein
MPASANRALMVGLSIRLMPNTTALWHSWRLVTMVAVLHAVMAAEHAVSIERQGYSGTIAHALMQRAEDGSSGAELGLMQPMPQLAFRRRAFTWYELGKASCDGAVFARCSSSRGEAE